MTVPFNASSTQLQKEKNLNHVKKKKELKSFQAPQAVVLILFPFPLHSTTLTRCNSTARLNFERSGKQYDPTSTTITLIGEIDTVRQEVESNTAHVVQCSYAHL